ncbi:MAG: putative lysis protein [Perrunavirus faecadaptatum]|uniref:Lysis protein n=1 Tax=Leviviridae sp. TaxID=2027243 RepID=A0ABY3SSD5_9VIRU|nr:MAG: putative lysis protein [Leviviridae sp.]
MSTNHLDIAAKLLLQLTIRIILWSRNILALAGLLFVILLATHQLSIDIYSP